MAVLLPATNWNAAAIKQMSVQDLAQGAYFVRVVGESVNMVRKLVVR